MATTLVTAPTDEPISLQDLKEALRIDGNESDNELENLLTEATEWVEDMTGRKLITQTWKLVLDTLDSKIHLPYAPLQSVTSITYVDASGSSPMTTLAAANYIVDTDSEPARIYRSSTGVYPSTYSDINVVEIKFVCGYGDRDDVPEQLKRAIKLYAQWQWDQDGNYEEPLNHLINKWKIPWFALES